MGSKVSNGSVWLLILVTFQDPCANAAKDIKIKTSIANMRIAIQVPLSLYRPCGGSTARERIYPKSPGAPSEPHPPMSIGNSAQFRKSRETASSGGPHIELPDSNGARHRGLLRRARCGYCGTIFAIAT